MVKVRQILDQQDVWKYMITKTSCYTVDTSTSQGWC